MGFFDSSKSHVELLEKDCRLVAELAAKIRDRCDESLKGKYDYAQPEQRAEQVRDGLRLLEKLTAALASARERKAVMEQDQCPKEDLLAAQTLLLSVSLDVTRAEKAVADAKGSLVAGAAEIEAFYGPRSKEAKEMRRVLSDFQISA